MLAFPFENPPETGEVIAIREGLLWARLPLPFRLDHINIYLLEDDDGWIIIDAGIDSKGSRASWQALLDGPLKGFSFKALLITHHHPDHIGLAGWLCETLEIPLMTSRTGFLAAMNFYNSPEILAATDYSRFYASHGMTPEIAALVSTMGQEYMQMLSKPPFTYQRVQDGDELVIGGRHVHVIAGEGHCPEQLMLHIPDEGLFLAADQVLERISPNISVSAFEPAGDPLGGFIQSLQQLQAAVAEDVLVLAGHRLPFHGLHARAQELIDHHEERCQIIMTELSNGPRSAADLLPLLFHRDLTPHEMSWAFNEVLAHMNYLITQGRCHWQDVDQGTRVIHTAAV